MHRTVHFASAEDGVENLVFVNVIEPEDFEKSRIDDSTLLSVQSRKFLYLFFYHRNPRLYYPRLHRTRKDLVKERC